MAQTRRLLFAKKLIDETDLSMVDIAFSAGYSSVRRFNEALKQTYARTPSELRRKRRRSSSDPSIASVELKLFYRDPYDWPAMLAFIAEHATPLVETVDRTIYRRTIRIGDVRGVISVRPLVDKRAVLLRVPIELSRYLLPITERIKQMFDLKADPALIAEELYHEPATIEIVETHPGVRLPGCWDGFEATLSALLRRSIGDNAKEILTALVERAGDPYAESGNPALTRLFPTAEQLRAAPLDEIGIPAPLAESIRMLSDRVMDGTIDFGAGVERQQLEEQLRTIPGVDEDVIQYVVLRSLGEPDLDLSGNPLLFGCSEKRLPGSIDSLVEELCRNVSLGGEPNENATGGVSRNRWSHSTRTIMKGNTTVPTRTTTDTDLATLDELNRNYIRSVQESDVAWFDRNLAEDFRCSNPDGSIVDRAGFLEQTARPVTISDLQAGDVEIRLMGDFAIIHATTSYALADGAAKRGRYTDVWTNQSGRWLCVSAHVTRG